MLTIMIDALPQRLLQSCCSRSPREDHTNMKLLRSPSSLSRTQNPASIYSQCHSYVFLPSLHDERAYLRPYSELRQCNFRSSTYITMSKICTSCTDLDPIFEVLWVIPNTNSLRRSHCICICEWAAKTSLSSERSLATPQKFYLNTEQFLHIRVNFSLSHFSVDLLSLHMV